MITEAMAGVGFYGKLPIIGDFIVRRLPDEFIKPWDHWLQSAITASRETLGDDWLSGYLTCPIWQFLLSPGVCGSKAVAGIVMPSVDKVGRYFPLTVAVQLESSPFVPWLFMACNAWFEQLEDAALMGLEGQLDLLGFDQLIQSIPICSSPPAQDAAEPLSAALETKGLMSGYSLWRNAGSEHVASALLAYQGLPPVGSFAEFLSGKHDPQFLISSVAMPAVELESTRINDHNQPEPYWRSWAITHTGKQRKHNEDAFLNRPEAGLWIVADGMGGHQAGDVASQLIVDTLKDLSPTVPLESFVKQVDHSLQRVNTQLRQLAMRDYGNHLIGSTVVGLICESERCAVLWAGDSRLYRFRDETLRQLTQDHCELYGQPTTSESLKNNNVITRAVGADDELALDCLMLEAYAGDVFLLCSDGLDKEMSLKEIERVMQVNEFQDIAGTLVNLVLDRGARDNVTVVVVARN